MWGWTFNSKTWSYYCYQLRAGSDNTELSTLAGSASPGRISRLVLELICLLGKLVFLVLDMNIWLSYVSYWVLKDNNSFSPYIFCQYLGNCIVIVCPSLAHSTNVSLSCVVMKLMALLLYCCMYCYTPPPPTRYNICYISSPLLSSCWGWFGAFSPRKWLTAAQPFNYSSCGCITRDCLDTQPNWRLSLVWQDSRAYFKLVSN